MSCTSIRRLIHSAEHHTGPVAIGEQPSAIDRLTSSVFTATNPAHLKTSSSKKLMEECLRHIACMYKSSPELRTRLVDLRERINVSKIWTELGFDTSALTTDFESVRFLVKGRLIFSIAGLEQTSSFGQDQIRIESGKLFILCDGEFVPVSLLIDRFVYDKEDFQYKEKATGLFWNYLLPKGLVQIDRYKTASLVPTTQLSPEEKKLLLEHAGQFETLSFQKDHPPVAVLQIVTNPRKRIKRDSFLFDGLEAQNPVHVGFRIIDENGDVFSSGFTYSDEEEKHRAGLRNYMASINGVPDITDFEEFRSHEGRRVTSIPMTKETCDRIKNEVRLMCAHGVRFNMLTQNCSRMASRMAELAGVTIDHKQTVYHTVPNIFPSLASFPRLQRVIEKLLTLSHKLSEKTLLPSVEEDIRFAKKIVAIAITPVRLITNLVLNLLFMALGAHKGSPMRQTLYEDSSNNGMRKFFAIISSPKDLFLTPILYHSGPIISWQDEQKSTCFYKYTKPSMNILPEPESTVPALKKRPYRRFGGRLAAQVRQSTLAKKRAQLFNRFKVKVKTAP